jgi:hypothetical protein
MAFIHLNIIQEAKETKKTFQDIIDEAGHYQASIEGSVKN